MNTVPKWFKVGSVVVINVPNNSLDGRTGVIRCVISMGGSYFAMISVGRHLSYFAAPSEVNPANLISAEELLG